MHLAQCTLFYIKCCGSVLSICSLLYFQYFNFSTERKKQTTFSLNVTLPLTSFSVGIHDLCWTRVCRVCHQNCQLEFFCRVFFFFFPVETSLQKRVANQLILTFKHINSSFTMASILLCQKRDKILICHQPMLLPKLPFTIGNCSRF